jgi:hypothetical protein
MKNALKNKQTDKANADDLADRIILASFSADRAQKNWGIVLTGPE